MIENIFIRPARESDLERMTKIFIENNLRSSHKENWNFERASARVKGYYDIAANQVVGINNSVEGFVSLEIFEDVESPAGYILQFMISPDFQSKGIGKRLMQSAEDYFKKKGVKDIYLEVYRDSKAVKLYQNIGYHETEMICMEKTLD